MIIKSLEVMEKIVAKNNNLYWVGWDVADRKRSDGARTSVNGVRVNNKWYLQKIYKLGRNGWDIPNKYRG
jgi:hypothetical protein